MDRVAGCATGEAAWHAAAYAGLGAIWTYGDGVAYGVPPHRFLQAIVTLSPTPALEPVLAELGERPGELRDSWGLLATTTLPGWRARTADPWMYRDPAPCPAPEIEGITIERTTDALLFERTAFLAVSGRAPEQPGELHPADFAEVPGVQLFLARRGADPVGTSLAVVHDAGVTVSAVSVLPTERRLGIGAALTAAAVAAADDRPATLTTSELGAGVYARLGFVDVGRGLDWSPQR